MLFISLINLILLFLCLIILFYLAFTKTFYSLQSFISQNKLSYFPNRTAFLKYLDKKINYPVNNKHWVVCMIGIDNFKQINYSLGYYAGDEILVIIGKMLRSILNKKDFIARMGGDEFGIVIDQIHQEQDLHQILKRIIDTLSKPIRLIDIDIYVSVSIGVSIYTHGQMDSNELIRNADIAMYHAKEKGKKNYSIFDNALNQEMNRRRQIDLQIRHALNRNELSLEYQLLIDAKTLKPFGLEALLRWNNIYFGMISPKEFIPIAETNGAIFQIGEWALRQACYDFSKLISEKNHHLILSVNVSMTQLENEDFAVMLESILKETNINRSHLLLEVTETAFMHHPILVKKVSSKIKKLGVNLALDDFGVNYSTVKYIKELPVSLLKVDQEFVKNILVNRSDLEIVNATIQLAHGMGMKIIAEGIENEEQLELLKKLGCEYVQGYYFMEPLPIDKLLVQPILNKSV